MESKKDKYAMYLKLKVDDNLWREELEISSREMRQVINATSNSDGVNPKEFEEKINEYLFKNFIKLILINILFINPINSKTLPPGTGVKLMFLLTF